MSSPAADPDFVHLRLHSEYSVSDGIVRIDDAVTRAAGDGMPALAITDLSNVFGLVKFYQAARGKGIKPLVGCDLWLTNDKDRNKPSRFLLLCQNRQGYKLLSELLSRAFRTNQHRGRAEIAPAWFDEMGTQDLIALSGAAAGEVSQCLLAGNDKAANASAKRWSKWFPGRFYLELQRTGAAGEEALVQHSVQLAAKLKLPVVATHPIQFMQRDEFRAHEARVCISEGYILADRRRPKAFTEEQYFKSRQEMTALFADIPSALANSVEIAKRCNLTLELGKSKLPLFPTPGGVPLEAFFAEEARRGLEARMAAALSQRRRACARVVALPPPVSKSRSTPSSRWVSGLLPHRGGFHPVGEEQRRAGGPRARLRRRLAGGLQPEHHRPRSAALRPAVRALSQS